MIVLTPIDKLNELEIRKMCCHRDCLNSSEMCSSLLPCYQNWILLYFCATFVCFSKLQELWSKLCESLDTTLQMTIFPLSLTQHVMLLSMILKSSVIIWRLCLSKYSHVSLALKSAFLRIETFLSVYINVYAFSSLKIYTFNIVLLPIFYLKQ